MRKERRSTLSRIVALLLAAVMCMAMFAGCKKEEAPAAESPTDVVEQVGVQWTEAGVPFINETFEGSEHCGLERGEVAFEVVTEQVTDEEGKTADNKALHVSNRTESWNGVNFAADEFRGNKISAWAKVKSASSGIHVTLQYDLAGTTSYTWIASMAGSETEYVSVGGEKTIPAEAKNIFVYVESDSLSDLYVDDVTVRVIGAYTSYAEKEDAGYADYTKYEQLKDVYADYFNIGCAVPATYVSNTHKEYIDLVTRQFNAITFENEFKPDGILDYASSKADLEKYNESPAVKFDNVIETLDYARDNNIKVRGHVLTWHSQTPEWLFYEDYDTSKSYASRELMLKRMENYIKSVLTWCEENYPGVFYAWDVVNEAIDDNTDKLRTNVPWTLTVGEDWVQYAFKFARQYAGEGVKLFYNDYNEFKIGKCNGIIDLLTPVAKAGNIDGVGMQGHIDAKVAPSMFVDCAWDYANKLGVVINVTELDIEQSTAADKEAAQGRYYNKFFRSLIEAKKEGLPLEAVTIWGLCDNLSWKADTKPLLFNGDLSAKPAFDGMVLAAKGEEMK